MASLRAKRRRPGTRTPRGVRTRSGPSPPGFGGGGRLRSAHGARAAFPVVGIGASAGGLEAITQLLENVRADSGAAFVVVQHLDPVRESGLAGLLGRATALPVLEATDGLAVEPGHVYVIPHNRDIVIEAGRLTLLPRRRSPGARRSIDAFFESLAQDQGERAIGVVLSGTAADGTLGLEAIRAEGGLTFAQDETAKYDSMPRSAIASGCVDFVLPPAEIARRLERVLRHSCAVDDGDAAPSRRRTGGGTAGPARRAADAARTPSARARGRERAATAPSRVDAEEPGIGDGYRDVLLLLRQHGGVDFTSYKPSTVTRRIRRRMVLNQVAALGDYARLLRGSAKELDALHADMLIGLTGFFRDPEAFDVLKATVLSRLAKRTGGGPVRVWVPGCSTGQEAYSVVMAFAEASDGVVRPPPLQVFATDVNRWAVDVARTGRYSKGSVADVSPERVRRFFEEESGGLRVRKAVRERVVFAQHDLLRAPPFSHLDLVCCRNLLIYLRSDAQRRLFSLFAYALDPGGCLFLGASESPGSLTDAFRPVDGKARIYARVGTRAGLPPRDAALAHAPRPGPAPSPREEPHAEVGVVCAADRVALGRYAPRGVLVDSELRVLEFRGDTRPWLRPPTGRASFELRKVAHESLLGPLRSALREAKREQRAVRKDRVRLHEDGRARTTAIEVIPLRHRDEEYFLVFFEPAPDRVQPAPEAAEGGETRGRGRAAPKDASPALRRRVADLGRELAEAQDGLQALQQQHDAALEELRSANEEATSANEELQSLNEELEASKEELESANEELTTVNDELANQNAALARTNSDLQNTERAAELEIVLVAADATVRRFTPAAAAHFGLQASDIGRPLQAFQSKMGLGGAKDPVAEVVALGTERRLEFQDFAGRWYSSWLHPYRGASGEVEGVVLSFLDIDARKRAEDVVKEALTYAEAILNTVRDPIVVLDASLRVHGANQAFLTMFRTSAAEVVGQSIWTLGKGRWAVPVLRTRLQDILPRNSSFDSLEITLDVEGVGRRTLLVGARPLREPGEQAAKVLMSVRDITEALQFQVQDRAEGARFRRLFETSPDGILILDANTGRIREANAAAAAMVGCTADDLRSSDAAALPLSTDAGPLQLSLDVLQEQGHGSIRRRRCVLTSRTGVRRTVELRARLHEDPIGRLIEVNLRERRETPSA